MTIESSGAPTSPGRRRLATAIRIVVIVAIAAALWWFVHEMDFAALGEALSTAKAWPLVVAALLNFGCLWGKAVCWRIMLAPRHRITTARLFRYTIAAFAASAIAPARAGEVLRVWTLKRNDGVPMADTAAVAVAEKLMDGISMLILAAPIPWLLPDLPAIVMVAIAGCAAIAIGLFIALYIAVGRVKPAAVPSSSSSSTSSSSTSSSSTSSSSTSTSTSTSSPSTSSSSLSSSRAWVRRFLDGMHVLRSPKRVLGSLAVLLGVWAADLAAVMLVLYAVDIHLPVAAGLLILFTLNLFIILPSTPAQLGALELGAIGALKLLNVVDEPAVAFALLYHALQVIPLIIAGLIFTPRLVLGREGAPPSAETCPPPSAPLPAATCAPDDLRERAL